MLMVLFAQDVTVFKAWFKLRETPGIHVSLWARVHTNVEKTARWYFHKVFFFFFMANILQKLLNKHSLSFSLCLYIILGLVFGPQ